jgi:hypothetical protein
MKHYLFHLTVLIGYALLFVLPFRTLELFSLFFVGLLCGYLFPVFDRIIQITLFSSEKHLFNHWIGLVKQGKLIESLQYLQRTVHPVSYSLYFLLVYIVLAFYVVTSTGSVFGTGIVLGLGLLYASHFILEYEHTSRLRERFLPELRHTVSDQDVKKMLAVFVILFGLLTFLPFL